MSISRAEGLNLEKFKIHIKIHINMRSEIYVYFNVNFKLFQV